MSVSPSICIPSVLVARVLNKTISVPIFLCEFQKNNKTVDLEALLDSGAGGLFIDKTFTKRNNFTLHELPEPLNAYNVDGTLNKKGTITSYVEADLKIGEWIKQTHLYVTGLGKQKVILGFPWLQDENPTVDWKSSEIQWKKQEWQRLGQKAIDLTQASFAKRKEAFTPVAEQTKIMIIPAEEQRKFEDYAKALLADPTSQIHKLLNTEFDIGQIDFDVSETEFDDNTLLILYINGETTSELDDVLINSTMSHSQAFSWKYEGNTQDERIDLNDAVPPQFHEYLKVFSDEKSTWFPKSTPWDHKIEMKAGFEPKSFKIYPITPEEDTMTKAFINDNLEKGYIRPSKSPMATPFFFVNKKGTSKKWPCQDYCYLNNWTVKNTYPLPLISDIMDKVKTMKYFTKMGVRLGYNNVRIHEGDEWKAAFKTKYRLFEPLVMFFGLCNSLATFQHMMDNIFIVQTTKGRMIIYMDNMLILAETMDELNRTRTRKNRKFRGPQKTMTAVRSSVLCNSWNLGTDKRPVETGLNRSFPLKGWVSFS